MPYSQVTHEPPRIPDAFRMDTDAAVQCQAACLLYLGALFRPATTIARYKQPLADHEMVPVGDLELLGIPRNIVGLDIEISPEYLLLSKTLAEIEQENSLAAGTILAPVAGGSMDAKLTGDLQAKYVIRFFETQEVRALIKLLALSLHHNDELVRVAAAISYIDAVNGLIIPRPDFYEDIDRCVSILVRGTASEEPLIRDVAATALARILPYHPALQRLLEKTDRNGEGEPAHTSLIIHGTWARTSTWWQPGGSFHSYILQFVDPSVYAGSDRFEWSGGYSDHARALGALDLCRWVQDKGLNSPDFFAHSYGCSVGLLANHTIDIGRMVLLSCPVHKAKYWPNFGHVNRVASVRVHLDLVILADRGGQLFNDPRIVENVLPIWFDHLITYNPDIWTQYDIPSLI